MNTDLFKRMFGSSISCAELPAGIEILDPPDTVTLLIPGHRNLNVTEGAFVTAGDSLCDRPGTGTFSSIDGTVCRISPWDGGTAGRYTAVTVVKNTGDTTGKNNQRRHLFSPSNDVAVIAPEVLRERCAICGFELPEKNVPILIMMLDEDIDRTVNRWYFEKEFDRILTGLKLIKRMLPENATTIAIPVNSPVEKIQSCAEWGRVVALPPRYPDATVNALLLHDAELQQFPTLTVIDARRLAAMVSSLISGYPVTTFLMSFKYGRKEASKLFQISAGMTVGQFLSRVNISPERGMQIVVGGEMCGISIQSLSHPLVPPVDSLLVIPPEEVVTTENSVCVNCGKCSRACPIALRVDLLGKCIERGLLDEAKRLGIRECTGCGLCTTVCIVRRPLAHLIAFGKSITIQNDHLGEAASPVQKVAVQ